MEATNAGLYQDAARLIGGGQGYIHLNLVVRTVALQEAVNVTNHIARNAWIGTFPN